MTDKRTRIAGYLVEVDTDMDGLERAITGCWISIGDYSASLEAADATGVLEDSGGLEHHISASTVARIRSWAEANGY